MKKSEQQEFLAELKRQRLLMKSHGKVADSPHSGAAGRARAREMEKRAGDAIDTMLSWAAGDQ
jgi:hypothetical protein